MFSSWYFHGVEKSALSYLLKTHGFFQIEFYYNVTYKRIPDYLEHHKFSRQTNSKDLILTANNAKYKLIFQVYKGKV